MAMKNEAAKVHLITCLADALQKSIALQLGEQWYCAASTAASETAPSDGRSLSMQIRLRGNIHGELRLEIAENDARSLLSLDGSEPAGPAWQKIMEGMIQRLPKRAMDAGMFAFSVESSVLTDPFPGCIEIGKMELGYAERAPFALHVLANDELAESFRVVHWNASRSSTGSDTPHAVSPELGRVIDVPLIVTLRFGQRTMRLREVLELNTGTLVELDRQVEEPVDLILDERVIARGEVVIVDGNYGLRVTEIVERPPTVVL